MANCVAGDWWLEVGKVRTVDVLTSAILSLLGGQAREREHGQRHARQVQCVHVRRRSLPMTDAETQIESFFAKYEPAIAELGRTLRAKLRARLPGLFELVYVYDSQDSLVISYSPTEAGADGVCAIALYPRRVSLFFTGGALLSKSDPKRLLQGRGKTVRYVGLNSVADFDRAEIEVLMAAALKLAKVRLDANARSSVIIKAAAQKQRARRATKAARPAATRRTTKARR